MSAARYCFAACAIIWAALAFGATTISIDRIMLAIRAVESGGHPYAIRDNTANRSYFLGSRDEAIAKVRELVARNHNIDMGPMQINSIHLRRPGISIDTIFDAGIQSSLARTIFDEFHTQSKAIHGDSDLALWRAVGAYNMGVAGLRFDNTAYISKVMAQVGIARVAPGAEVSHGSGALQGVVNLAEQLTRFATPFQWRIGERIELGESIERLSADAELWEGTDIAGGLLLLIIAIAVLFLIAKLGLIYATAKVITKLTASQAIAQMTRRRQTPT